MRTILASVLFVSAMLAPAAPAAGETGFYVKKDAWTATMLATRDRYQALLDAAPVSAGPWSATAALKAKSFGDALFPEQGVDLAAKDEKGQPVWRQPQAKP